jgi:sugar lactone lactonase YvrE
MRLTKAKRVIAFSGMTVAFLIGFAAPFHSQDGPATETPILRGPALAVDASGNVFVLDGTNVRKAAADGTIKTIAGTAESGLEYPTDLAVDATGNLYIADNLGHRIRKMSPAGVITTVAGTGEPGFAGDAGPAVKAQLQSPLRVAVDAAGNLYIADSGNMRIRKVSASGVMSTIVGTGRAGFNGDGGPAGNAQIHLVNGLGVDGAGNVYFADAGNARIRKVTRGVISTIAGRGTPGFNGDGGGALMALIDPYNLAVDGAGNVYIVEINRIRRVGTDGVIRTIAGNGTPGFSGDGGPAVSAQLRGPSAVAVDAKGNLYIADTMNGRVRKVAANGTISVVAGAPLPSAPPLPTTAQATDPRGQITFSSVISTPPGLSFPYTSPPPTIILAPSGRPVLLETRLASLAPSAKDCGHTPKDAAATVISCVETAVRGKAPFVASFTQQSIDSTVVQALAAPLAGTAVQVLFDSGSGGRDLRVSTPQNCAAPQLSASGATVRLTCP